MGSLKSQFRHLELHLALLSDGIARGLPFNNKDIQTLTVRFRNEGSSFFNVTLPSLGRAVDVGLVCGTFACPAAFKVGKGDRLPLLFNDVFKTVFDSRGSLLSQPNVTAIFMLRQVCLLQSKLVTEFTKKQEDEAVKSFVEGQSTLRKIRLNTDDPTLRIARAILKYALRGLDLSRITPGHGPGAVHEKRDHEERWDFTYWPVKANKVYPYHEYGVQSLEHLREQSNRVIFLSRMTTRVALVPKDFRGPRLISIEMSAQQYLQQGQMRKMMDYIDSHALLKLSMRMRDQTLNQFAAMKAYENDHATLDLSNASDTVSLPLFWYLFSGVPKLRRLLCRTRSDYATYGSQMIRLCAMSPMGSATCFPIETLVFWSLSLATMYRLSGFDLCDLNRGALFELSSSLKVFGDDIVVPRIFLEPLMATLRTVGCLPNMSKTCSATPFRESCGTEWFEGIPVSITRNKKVGLHEEDKLAQHPDYIDLQRKLYAGGLCNAAKLVSHWALKIAPVPVQVFSFRRAEYEYNSSQFSVFERQCREQVEIRAHLDRSGQVCDVPRVDYHPTLLGEADQIDSRLRLRWNDGLQRVEFRVARFYRETRDWRGEGYARLLARCISPSFDRIAIRETAVRYSWVPMPQGSYIVV